MLDCKRFCGSAIPSSRLHRKQSLPQPQEIVPYCPPESQVLQPSDADPNLRSFSDGQSLPSDSSSDSSNTPSINPHQNQATEPAVPTPERFNTSADNLPQQDLGLAAQYRLRPTDTLRGSLNTIGDFFMPTGGSGMRIGRSGLITFPSPFSGLHDDLARIEGLPNSVGIGIFDTDSAYVDGQFFEDNLLIRPTIPLPFDQFGNYNTHLDGGGLGRIVIPFAVDGSSSFYNSRLSPYIQGRFGAGEVYFDDANAEQESWSSFPIGNALTTVVGYRLSQRYYWISNQPLIFLASPGAQVGRSKLSDNNNPLPRNRFFFDFSYFRNAMLTTQGSNVQRYTPGLERMLVDGQSSIELRVPVAVTASSTIETDSQGLDLSHGELGNISLAFKQILLQRSGFWLTGGLGVQLPTADDIDVRLSNGTNLLRVRNQSVRILPISRPSTTMVRGFGKTTSSLTSARMAIQCLGTWEMA